MNRKNKTQKDKLPRFFRGGVKGWIEQMKSSTNLKDTKQKDVLNIRWMLVGYDLIVYAIVASLLLAAYGARTNYHLPAYFNKYAYLRYAFLQYVFWVKSTDRYGDMVEYSVTFVYFLRMPLLFSCTCVWNF